MSSSDNLPLNELEKELLDPSSDCYLENLLDVVSALVTDCDFPSAKNSKGVQSFLKKYSQAAKIIESRRTKYTDFELIKVIGQGGFGRVELARHKRTRRVYAIKLMSKQHLLDHSQSGYWEERDVMVKASSEWLVACHYAFLDKDNVYLCMEYMPGGDLYYWLEKYDTFDETIARFYLAETVLALEALHQLGFIHRDLKPDNMLLDAKGHLKLADFGSCVRVGQDGYYYCTSPIGTPDYISPEMLSCQAKAGKIGPACDWWALGVIAYEMFFGEPAFYGQSLVETYSRILAHEKSLRIPTDADPISPETEQFIRDLLKSPTTRLGSFDLLTEAEIITAKSNKAVAAAQQVKSHAFFKSIQWEQLRSENPPIQPVVNSETDTSNINFDERDLSSDNVGSGGGGGGGSGMKLPHSGGAFAPARPQTPAYFTGSNLSFAGFTFNRYHRYLEMFSRVTNTNNTTTTNNNNNSTATNDNQPLESGLVDTQSSKQLTEAIERQKLTEETLNNLKQAFQNLQCQSSKDQLSLKSMNQQLVDSQNEVKQLKSVKTDFECQLLDLNNQINNLHSERDALQAKIKELEVQCQTITLNYETEHREYAGLKSDKEALDQRIQQLEKELLKQQKDLETMSAAAAAGKQPSSDTSPTTDNDTTQMINELNDLITNLKVQNSTLLSENQEAEKKCTALMNVVSELRKNLEEQVKELTDQLQTTQELSCTHLTKYKETADLLEQSKLTIERLHNDLSVSQANLDKTLQGKQTIEEELIQKDSELSMAQVRLRSLETNLDSVRKHADEEIHRLNSLVNRQAVEMNDLSKQLDEMRNCCANVETTNGRLTERVQQLQKDKEIQQRNLDTLVEKFYSEMKTRTIPPPVKSKIVNRDEYKQLEKKYKNLQSTTQKDIANLHATIEQYKKDLAERSNLITSLTEECQNMYKELGQQRQLERNLRARLDYYVNPHSTTLTKDGNYQQHQQQNSSTVSIRTAAGGDNSGGAGDTTLLSAAEENSAQPSPCVDTSVITGGGGGGCGIPSNILNIILEDIVDIDSKGRGKHKLIWLPKYAVLKRFSLLFYPSRAERESNPSLAEEIPLYCIMHVREATELDLIHAKKEDLCKTIQIFYQNPTTTTTTTAAAASKVVQHVYDSNNNNNNNSNNEDTELDVCETSVTSSGTQNSLQLSSSMLKSSSRSNQDHTTTTNNNNTSNTITTNSTNIQWMSHNFQLMRFHLGNVLCDVCHKNCSDLLNPPKALECLNCRLRIHFDHVDKHEKFTSCHNAANVRYLRMSNSAVKKNYSKQQQDPEQISLLIDADVSLTGGDGGGGSTTSSNSSNNNILQYMSPMKPIYRSMRAGSLGPSTIQQGSITTNQRSDSLNYLQYSFRKKITGGSRAGGGTSSTPKNNNNKSPRSASPALVFPKFEDR
ncbi:unnamed protein product [Trichobilharzia szidati]|nr:unnamed protein product [Trichobilharzia szidati]